MAKRSHTKAASSNPNAASAMPPEVTEACPSCNYDCRGLTRCPECGLDLTDPTLIRQRTLPWVNRKAIGRVTAFYRTAHFVFRHPLQLANSAYVAQDDRTARGFAWVCIALAGTIVFLATCVGGGPLLELIQGAEVNGWNLSVLLHTAEPADLLLPLLLTAKVWTLAIAASLFVAIYPWSLVTPFALLRENGQVTERAMRCAALTRYLAAGFIAIALGYALVLLLPHKALGAILELPEARRELLLPAILLLILGTTPILVYPLILLRRAGGEWWQVALAAVIYLVQFCLIVALAYAAVFFLPGLILEYREILR